MAVTVYDIARTSGYSQPTVSQILSGKAGRYRPDTRRRVIEVARKMGYRPNAAARQIRARRFNAAALISRRAIGPTHLELLKGVGRELSKHDMHMIHAEIETAQKFDPETAPRFLRELCVDGMILDECGTVPRELLDELDALHVPAIAVNADVDHDCVNPDDLEAAQRLARLVLDAGHRRIAYVGMLTPVPEVHFSAIERIRGCREVVAEAGLALSEHAAAPIHTVDDAYELLMCNREVTAWVFASDRDAMRMCLAAERAHLRLPRDLSVVTFMNTGLAADAPVRLTGMLNPMKPIGFVAAQMLVEKIRDPLKTLPVRRVPWRGPDDREPHGATLGPPAND